MMTTDAPERDQEAVCHLPWGFHETWKPRISLRAGETQESTLQVRLRSLAADALASAFWQASEQSLEDDPGDEHRASRIEHHTRDFVLEAVPRNLSHQEFREFTAGLLRALGYQARIAHYSQGRGREL